MPHSLHHLLRPSLASVTERLTIDELPFLKTSSQSSSCYRSHVFSFMCIKLGISLWLPAKNKLPALNYVNLQASSSWSSSPLLSPSTIPAFSSKLSHETPCRNLQPTWDQRMKKPSSADPIYCHTDKTSCLYTFLHDVPFRGLKCFHFYVCFLNSWLLSKSFGSYYHLSENFSKIPRKTNLFHHCMLSGISIYYNCETWQIID